MELNRRSVDFIGEESARFVEFAKFVLACGLTCNVEVEARDPLTSRLVVLNGRVTNPIRDGYLRYLVVTEDGSETEYWVAGSNATRSLATRTIRFMFTDTDYRQLCQHAEQSARYIPGLTALLNLSTDKYRRLDKSPYVLDKAELDFVLDCLGSSDEILAEEAALTLRSFGSFVTRRKSTQLKTEQKIIATLEAMSHLNTRLNTRIALIEDLGYVGTSASYNILSQYATDVGANEQIRWSSGVALARISGDQVVAPLIQLARTSANWVAAAALLGLSRHANEHNRAVLEPVFFEFLGATQQPTIQRYACLGLSHFDSLESTTVSRVLELLETTGSPIEVVGFAALTLSSVLRTVNYAMRARINYAIENLVSRSLPSSNEPEVVWGLEFLAELATISELNDEAAELHLLLSERFDDWRSLYYEAMSFYELSESKCRSGNYDEVTQHLRSSLELLRSIEPQSTAEQETIQFRIDLVGARLALHDVLLSWTQALETRQLSSVAEEIDAVTRTYAVYAQPITIGKRKEGVKRLSQREADYLRKTLSLLHIVKMVAQLDVDSRRAEAADILQSAVVRIDTALAQMTLQFTNHLAEGPTRVVSRAKPIAERMKIVLDMQRTGTGEKLEEISQCIAQMKEIFVQSTWPMPARACPIGGLGRGTIHVLSEDVPGAGTTEDPYRFAPDSPAVLNIVAEIVEMAPGAATRAEVVLEIAGRTLIQRLSAVEGSVRVSFVLPDVLSARASTTASAQLVFGTRDCNQVAHRLSALMRRDAS